MSDPMFVLVVFRWRLLTDHWCVLIELKEALQLGPLPEPSEPEQDIEMEHQTPAPPQQDKPQALLKGQFESPMHPDDSGVGNEEEEYFVEEMEENPLQVKMFDDQVLLHTFRSVNSGCVHLCRLMN